MKVLLIMACLIVGLNCHSTGPPESQCASMEPSHSPATATSGAGTYSVTPIRNSYGPGDKITVSISTTSTAFKGLFLQARYTPNGPVVGSWGPPAVGYKHVACDGSAHGAIGHGNNNAKTNDVFTWTAPLSGNQDVTFYATVVQQKDTYYVKIPSTKVVFASTTISPGIATQATGGLGNSSSATTPVMKSTQVPVTTTTMTTVASANTNTTSSSEIVILSKITLSMCVLVNAIYAYAFL